MHFCVELIVCAALRPHVHFGRPTVHDVKGVANLTLPHNSFAGWECLRPDNLGKLLEMARREGGEDARR